jgi:beta-lactamase superfamily II metal-dependent hydrolase
MMARKTTTDCSESLEIHVLGAGKGESIVLRWPEDKWGVVDCYAPSLSDHGTNPTLQFLIDQGVSQLDFLCLTHPHDDHFRGMSQLLERLDVKSFWRFAGLSGRDLRLLAQHMLVDAERSGNPEMTENANDFVRTMELVNKRRQDGQLRQKTATGFQQLYPIPADPSAHFQIWSFAPSGNQIGHYESALAACFTEEGRFRTLLPQAHHNSVSVGLLVRFGQTRVILGGDIERAGWNDVREELLREHLVANAVKVSHHGSETGYVPGLWDDLAGGKKPIAVIAPYRRFRLPKPEAIGHIRPHVSKILLTCNIDTATTPGAVTRPLKSRMFLRARLKARPAPPDAGCGRCMLVYDSSGNCTEDGCFAPAHELEDE